MRKRCKPEGGPIRAVFDKPATDRTAGVQYTVDLAAKDAEKVRAVAARCGMEALAFLEQYLCGTLPGQPPVLQNERPLDLRARDTTFACFDPTLSARIERAAEFRGKSLDEYVAEIVASSVLADEDDMILHPQTGEVVGDDLALEQLPGLKCPQVVAPPLGLPAAEWLGKYPGLNRVLEATDVRAQPTKQKDAEHAPERIVVQLDDLAGDMLRARLACEPLEDPRDVVNAAVTFYLCNPDEDHGQFDLSDAGDAMERARLARLRLEGSAG